MLYYKKRELFEENKLISFSKFMNIKKFTIFLTIIPLFSSQNIRIQNFAHNCHNDADCCQRQFCGADMLCHEKCTIIKCAENEVCRKGKCLKSCSCDDGCGMGLSCQNNVCIDKCDAVKCPAGKQCHKGNCLQRSNWADPCTIIKCRLGSKCTGGECINLCKNVICGINDSCVLGLCTPLLVPDCSTIKCRPGQVCSNGQCINTCKNNYCNGTHTCVNGSCVKIIV